MVIPCNTMKHRNDPVAMLCLPPLWYCVEQAWLETELPPADWLDDDTVEELAERNAWEEMINKLV